MKSRFLVAFIAIPTLGLGQATVQDAPALDAKLVLEALKVIKEQNEAGIKARKQNAYSKVMQAAASGATAAAFWKEAVKATEFAGGEKAGAKMSDWREADGEAFQSKECQNAARLHLYWLGLSLQHSMGTETKTMLQNVIDFTKQVRAEEESMQRLDAAIDRATDRKDREKAQEEQTVKRVHNQILRTSVGGTPVARWLQITDLLSDSGGKRGQRVEKAADKPATRGDSESWELTPGDIDGIFGSIILPEFRATKDPRLLEFWDMKIKTESEKASLKKLDIEERDWLQIRRPSLLWGRTQDLMILGQRNRGISEMLAILKSSPQHPQAGSWISAIENAVLGSLPVTATPPETPPGSVPAPVTVPPATAPAPASAPAVNPFRLNPVRPPAQ